MAAAAPRYVGQAVRRREDPRLLTGTGQYVDDVAVRGVVHAAFLRSDVARGDIQHLDVGAARMARGVHAVYTGADLNPSAGPLWATLGGPPGLFAHPPSHPLAGSEVKFVGDPVAVVIAESRALAEDACELIELDIRGRPALLDLHRPDRQVPESGDFVHQELGTNIASSIPMGDVTAVDEAFATAAHVVTGRFEMSRATCLPIEPRGLVASWNTTAKSLRVWTSSQNPHEVRAFCGRLLGISEVQIHVSIGDVGGGFGQKVFMTREEAAVVLAARALGRPVKWIEDRRESLVAANQARAECAEASFAIDADGHILAARVHHTEDVGAYPVGGIASIGGLVKLAFGGPYRIPLLAFSNTATFSNTCGKAAYRGPWLMETVTREQLVDHAARAIDMDPATFRSRNVLTAADMPYRNAGGSVYEDVDPAGPLAQALDLVRYEEFRAEQANARAAGRLVGLGLSLYIERSGGMSGPLASEQATIRLDPTGCVTVLMGLGSSGNSVETTIPQVVADALGCRLEDVVLVQGDTASTPYGHGNTGSRAGAFAGGAAQLSSMRMREKVVAIAAHMLEAAPEDIEMHDSRLSVAGSPTIQLSLSDVARAAYLRPELLPPGSEMGLEVSFRFRPPSPFTWSCSCHVCVCEVDPETGIVRIERYIVSEDCGSIINPMVVEGQIAGGVIQGIGGALYEHLAYDEHGNPVTTTLQDYMIPLASGTPMIEFAHVQTPSSFPGGFKGVGEGGAIGAPAAVANAVADALAPLGVTPTSLPIRPSDIVDLLADAGFRPSRGGDAG